MPCNIDVINLILHRHYSRLDMRPQQGKSTLVSTYREPCSASDGYGYQLVT